MGSYADTTAVFFMLRVSGPGCRMREASTMQAGSFGQPQLISPADAKISTARTSSLEKRET
jgi:hypothetical protein